MDNVVVEQQVLLVGIATVDEMMVVVNVVLQKKKNVLFFKSIKNLIYVVDIEMDFDLILAYYNVLMVLA